MASKTTAVNALAHACAPNTQPICRQTHQGFSKNTATDTLALLCIYQAFQMLYMNNPSQLTMILHTVKLECYHHVQ